MKIRLSTLKRIIREETSRVVSSSRSRVRLREMSDHDFYGRIIRQSQVDDVDMWNNVANQIVDGLDFDLAIEEMNDFLSSRYQLSDNDIDKMWELINDALIDWVND